MDNKQGRREGGGADDPKEVMVPTAPMLVYNNLVYDIQSGAAFTQSLASCCKVRDSVRKEVHRTLIFLPVNLMKLSCFT